MAASWFNRIADPAKAKALSAGTQPASKVHPVVVEAMREKGVDLSKAEPRKLTPELASGASFLVTMGCGEECPYIPGVPVLDWPFPDPKDQGIDSVRATRDRIGERVRSFIREQSWEGPETA